MQATARLTSKGQITIPKAVRDELELNAGDSVVFEVADGDASLKKVPNLLDLAGSVPVPPEKRGMSWEEIRRETRLERARRWR